MAFSPAPAARTMTSLRFVTQAVIWGGSFTLIGIAGQSFSPGFVVLTRLILGAVVLTLVALMRRERLVRGLRAWVFTAVGAVLSNVLPYLLLCYGEALISPGIAGVLIGATPLLTACLAAIVRPEERSPRTLVGLVPALLGLVLVVRPFDGVGTLLGGALCLLAAGSYAAGYVWARAFQSGPGTSPLGVAASQLIAAAAIQLCFTPVLCWEMGTPTPSALVATVALGMLGTGWATVLYFRLVRDIGATRAAAVDYLVPVVALGIAALSDPSLLTPLTLVGSALVITGLVVGDPSVRRRARSSRAPTVSDPERDARPS
ncbi:DMT family transporter [Microbacterium gorillae]|uniref:DMT family transporter n=1 Tax=Microbacterium gorillae TaxID=1231063 RepID=UPI0018A85604|nr:DMT family transporter [Microbacterium gorillae]